MEVTPSPDILSAELRQSLSRRFENIVVFSGAGLSADSGIPTFRSGENGLWSEFNPADLATPDAWKANKALVWGWYEWRRGLILKAQPNPGHLAIAQLQSTLNANAITQNVDDLHERAGVRDVLHLPAQGRERNQTVGVGVNSQAPAQLVGGQRPSPTDRELGFLAPGA